MISVRIPYLSPSLTRPIAMPATCDLIGTPASMRASEAPHTDAMDDEPFDSRMSETTRIVYGNSSFGGSTASTARSARAPWPMSRREGPPKRRPRLVEQAPGRVGARLLLVGGERGGELAGGEAPDAALELGVAPGAR